MKKLYSLVVLLATTFGSWLAAANSTTSVTQVTSAVTVSTNVDYVISSATPFTAEGTIDITNVEHAVVIIQSIKPSKVIASWLKGHVYINGVQAVNGSNCQVRMYGDGAIIYPYGNGIKPLTVYSEQSFGGESVNNFGLENSGGYMNTLSDAKLNNRIRSFKLKRGYMVTFSTRAEGRGYSRCFIADSEDLEVSALPAVLDSHISSYRVFQWLNAPKQGLASDTDAGRNAQVKSAWCYDWGTGRDLLPDYECVPNHIYEDWPSSSACGSVTYSCHMKTNNEPANSADDHPQDVATVLANWENLMRTGMRLCSPATHDGGWSWHNEFMKEIDARGWRCDIVDFHGYWDGEWSSLDWRIDTYAFGRPVWFSEWVWGASWNNNGAFNVSNRDDFAGNFERTYNGTKPILERLNANSRVERYAYWNGERNCSKILLEGKLSTLGEYYSKMTTGLGYKKANEFVPRTPPQKDPSNLVASYDKSTEQVELRWHDYNGEYNKSMTLQLKKPGATQWTAVQDMEQKEGEADYIVKLSGQAGYKYRVRIVDLNNKERLTNEATAVNEDIEAGDPVLVGENTYYLGGNMVANGDFELGFDGWTAGDGSAISAPYFQVLPEGGIDGGAYLQCYGNGASLTDAQTLRLVLPIEMGKSYYVSMAGCNNNPSYQGINTTSYLKLEVNSRLSLPAVTAWARQGASFTSQADTFLTVTVRNAAGKAQIDEVLVCRLWDTAEEALADAKKCAAKRLEAARTSPSIADDLKSELLAIDTTAMTAQQIEAAVNKVLRANRLVALVKWQERDAQLIAQLGLGAYTVQAGTLSSDDYIRLSEEYADMLPYTKSTTGISQPNFASAGNWVRSGSYTGGDQRLNTMSGKTCWNAWWNVAATTTTTLGVSQSVVTTLESGLYALQCKAGTQHYCETDQHAYLVNMTTNEKAVSMPLDLGLFDLPTFDANEQWRSLSTNYLYVGDGDQLTIGFESSKKGAVNGRWISYGNPTSKGDNREGWWCATDFALRYVRMYSRATDASGWGVICRPYNVKAAEGVLKYYTVAGITADAKYICLEPYSGDLQAGYPYVYCFEENSGAERNAGFIEMGTKATSPRTNENGLRGVFTTTSKYPAGALVLNNGEWVYTTDRPAIENYSAYIQKVSNLPVLVQWDGVKLPTSGLDPGLVGIPGVSATEQAPARCYNLMGMPIARPAQGTFISEGKIVNINR